MIFLIYVSSTIYGFYKLALDCLIYFSNALMGLILVYFEIPALNWS